VQVYYGLRAVVIHEGRTTSSGHFYTLTVSDDQWVRCDDMRVTEVTADQAAQASAAAYLCLYVRIGKS